MPLHSELSTGSSLSCLEYVPLQPSPNRASLAPDAPPTWQLAGSARAPSWPVIPISRSFFAKRRGFLCDQGWPGTDLLLCGGYKGLSVGGVHGRGRVQGKGATMRESVNGLFLTTTGQQLLVLWACSAGCSPAVWSQPGKGAGGMGGGVPQGQLRSPARPAFRLLCLPSDSPLPGQPCWGSLIARCCFSEASAGLTFSMRPAFSTVLSSSLCNLSLSLCSLAFSLSTVSIWARCAPPEVAKEAWVLAGPSTPGGLRAARCGGGWRS